VAVLSCSLADRDCSTGSSICRCRLSNCCKICSSIYWSVA